MIPFALKVAGYRNVQRALRQVVKTLPFPRPTLFNGPGSSLQLCDAIADMQIRRVLIVTDTVLLGLGLLDRITGRLEARGVTCVIYDGVLPDPDYRQVEAGLAILHERHCEGVLAVGGGSSIDCAKVIAALATNPKPVRKLAGMFRVFKPILPLFAIPTTAGTGSEVTVAAVVSDPVSHEKTPVMDPKLVPQAAALDGELMLGLPRAITAATGMDALTHAIEAYLSENALPDTDTYALAATRLIMTHLPIVMTDARNLTSRQELALASYYAGLAFTRAGVGYVHAIAHQFGTRYHTPHGLANAIALPWVLEYNRDACATRMARLAQVSGLSQGQGTHGELADRLIAHIRALKQQFNLPETLDSLQAADIPAIARAALKEAHTTYAVPRYMNHRACEQLLRKMLPETTQ